MARKLGAPFKPVPGEKDTYTFTYPDGTTRTFSPKRKRGRIIPSGTDVQTNDKLVRSNIAKLKAKSSAPKAVKVTTKQGAAKVDKKVAPVRPAESAGATTSRRISNDTIGNIGVGLTAAAAAAGAYAANKATKRARARVRAVGGKIKGHVKSRFNKMIEARKEAHSDKVGKKLPGDKSSTAEKEVQAAKKAAPTKKAGTKKAKITPRKPKAASRTKKAATEKSPKAAPKAANSTPKQAPLPKGVKEVRPGKHGGTEWVLEDKPKVTKQSSTPEKVIGKPSIKRSSPKQPDVSKAGRAADSPTHAGVDKNVADTSKIKAEIAQLEKENAALRAKKDTTPTKAENTAKSGKGGVILRKKGEPSYPIEKMDKPDITGKSPETVAKMEKAGPVGKSVAPVEKPGKTVIRGKRTITTRVITKSEPLPPKTGGTPLPVRAQTSPTEKSLTKEQLKQERAAAGKEYKARQAERGAKKSRELDKLIKEQSKDDYAKNSEAAKESKPKVRQPKTARGTLMKRRRQETKVGPSKGYAAKAGAEKAAERAKLIEQHMKKKGFTKVEGQGEEAKVFKVKGKKKTQVAGPTGTKAKGATEVAPKGGKPTIKARAAAIAKAAGKVGKATRGAGMVLGPLGTFTQFLEFKRMMEEARKRQQKYKKTGLIWEEGEL